MARLHCLGLAPTLVAVFVVAGCALLSAPGERVGLGNLTNIPIAVHVNGAWVGTYAPGTMSDVAIGGHGGPPYVIEVRSPTGGVLAGITISAQEAQAAAVGDISMGSTVGVPCGAIHLSYGSPAAMPQADPPVAGGHCP